MNRQCTNLGKACSSVSKKIKPSKKSVEFDIFGRYNSPIPMVGKKSPFVKCITQPKNKIQNDFLTCRQLSPLKRLLQQLHFRNLILEEISTS